MQCHERPHARSNSVVGGSRPTVRHARRSLLAVITSGLRSSLLDKDTLLGSRCSGQSTGKMPARCDGGGQASLARGPTKNQITSPRSGRSSITTVQMNFFPVLAPDCKTLTIAQTSASSNSRPSTPLTSSFTLHSFPEKDSTHPRTSVDLHEAFGLRFRRDAGYGGKIARHTAVPHLARW